MVRVVRRELGRPPRYPWDSWFDKSIENPDVAVVLTRGTDFDVAVENFRIQVLNAAKRRALVVATEANTEDETITFKVLKEKS